MEIHGMCQKKVQTTILRMFFFHFEMKFSGNGEEDASGEEQRRLRRRSRRRRRPLPSEIPPSGIAAALHSEQLINGIQSIPFFYSKTSIEVHFFP